MATIQLNKGAFAVVDDQFAHLSTKYKWRVVKKGQRSYAVRDRATYLHHEILKPPAGKMVDHINGDGLDCRSTNLRVATPQENTRNSARRITNRSGFKGVVFHRTAWSPRRPWRAVIMIDGKQKSLGCHPTKEQAALAYNAAAIRYFGNFARLNMVEA